MPWTKSENGEDEYKVSLYAKEELPTWDEMYSDFYKKEIFGYNEDDTELDPYWKIKRKMVQISMFCNQLNKMVFEDKMLGEIDPKMRDIRFIIYGYQIDVKSNNWFNPYKSHIEMEKWTDKHFCGKSTPPPIYAIHNPNGKENPFITNDHPRIYLQDEDINGIGSQIEFVTSHTIGGTLYVESIPLSLYKNRYHPDKDIGRIDKEISHYLDILMKPIIEYFEGGDKPGWKDEESKLFTKNLIRLVNDPAL